jgi:hypothetical protein
LTDPTERRQAVPGEFTVLNLADVDDAAPAHGFGEIWEARVARAALGAEQTGVRFFRLRPGRRSASPTATTRPRRCTSSWAAAA